MSVFMKPLCNTRDEYNDLCGMIADFYLKSGCRHEHLRQGPICIECKARIDSGEPMTCFQCDEGETRHDCELRVVSCEPIEWAHIGAVSP